MDASLVAEKVEQARDAVAESDADVWLIFCRETDEIHEPTLPYVLGFDVVWPTAIVIGSEESTVVLGQHDAPTAEELGVHEVRPYDESIEEPLRETLARLGAETVAVNFDRDDNVADGLTHGMYLRLDDLLPDREFVGAGGIVADVRGIKSGTEHERVAAAAETTLDLLHDAADEWTLETTEEEVADYLHGRMREAGFDSAWSWEYCPTVHAGGDADGGGEAQAERLGREPVVVDDVAVPEQPLDGRTLNGFEPAADERVGGFRRQREQERFDGVVGSHLVLRSRVPRPRRRRTG
ncbi:aminopeptidase P family N-terminal domain-containing protein [Halolamina salina]